MNDELTLKIIGRDANGVVLKDRNGRPLRIDQHVPSCRVKLTADRIFTTTGEETQATLEIAFPPEVNVQDGDEVAWTDMFGKVHSGNIAKLKDVLNFSGTVVYYRKAWTT